MSWTLGATTLKDPAPGNFTRQSVELKAEMTTLSGKTVKDVFGFKERYIIKEELLTKQESDNIVGEFTDKAEKAFVVTETNLTINTTVLVSVTQREYTVPGGDLRVDLVLDLIEVEAS